MNFSIFNNIILIKNNIIVYYKIKINQKIKRKLNFYYIVMNYIFYYNIHYIINLYH